MEEKSVRIAGLGNSRGKDRGKRMKIRKLVGVWCISVLLFGTAGCGNLPWQNSGKLQTDSSQVTSSVEEPSSQRPQSGTAEDAVSSNPPAPSEAPENSEAALTAPRTQQEALAQVRAAMTTKVSVMLPASVPTDTGRYLTAATNSQAAGYKVNFYETGEPSKIDSPAASKGTLIATVEGAEYKDAASAQDNIFGYEKVNTSTSDYGDILELGHNIKAVGSAGAGHQQLTWNEGRWCIRVDSPTDPAYKNKEYPDREQFAKSIVAYLDTHMLPAPQGIGVVSINIWEWNYGAAVEWQNHQTVYQVNSENPMTALKVAVAMELK